MNEAADREGTSVLARETLRSLAAALPQGLAIVCGERLLWANERLVEMSGRGELSSLLEVSLADLLTDASGEPPDPSERRAVECTLHRPDGQIRTVICRLVWREPSPGGCAWILEDVTHVRTLEQELLRMSQDLHRGNRELASLRDRLRNEHAEREELLTIVSHELRTPVTVISGYSRLLMAEEVGPLNAEQRRFLQESTKSCQKLDAFIGNLLEASREAKGGEVLEVCTGSLAPVIEGVAELFRAPFEEHRSHIRLSIDPKACHARFDRLRVEQVLANLVGNALKYATPDGTIEIATQELPASDPLYEPGRRFVEVSVTDDGPGIDRSQSERIFEPYVRLGADREAGGLGLGLAICKRLVESHGGQIGLTERPGGGCRFAFTLPSTDEGVAGSAAGEGA